MSAKIEELTVSKGKTIINSNGDPVKVHFGLKINTVTIESQKELDKARSQAEMLIDEWLAPYQTAQSTKPGLPNREEGRALAAEAQKIPEIDIADVDMLPWKGKRKALGKWTDQRGETWGWLFVQDKNYSAAEAEIVAKLDEAIRKAKGTLVLGDQQYSFSGSEAKIITRKAVKQETAR